MNGDRVAWNLMTLAARAGLDKSEHVRRLIHLAAVSGDGEAARLVRSVLEGYAIARTVSQHPYYIPVEAAEVAGPIQVGTEVYSGYRVGFHPAEGHMLVVGATGFGKTNLVMLILSRVMGELPFWAFDQKRDLRHLIRAHRNIYPVRLDEGLKFNPLRPFKRVHPRGWYQVFFDIFCQGEDLLSGSKAYGLELLDRLFNETPEPGPTMFDFTELVRAELKRLRPSTVRGRYAERLLTRLESLLTVFGDVYDCAVGFPMEDFAGENVVFETDGIDTLAAQFQIRCLLFANYCWRTEEGQRGDAARQLVVVDEGQVVFNPMEERKFASGVPFIDLMVQRAREFGLVFMVCNQNTRLAYSIKENSRIKVCFNLCEGYDQVSIARTMAMTRQQLAGIGGLGVGEALMQFAGRCPKPILVRVDHYPIEKSVDSEAVRTHVEPWLQHRRADVVKLRRPSPRRAISDGNGRPDSLTWEEETLLRDIVAAPGLDWSSRTQKLRLECDIGATAARKARERLERLGLIEVVRVRKGESKGASFVGLVLTSKGRAYLEARGARVGRAVRGSAVHRFWVDVVRAWCERNGLRCEVEASLTPNVCVDLLIYESDGRRTAVEVELSSKTALQNIHKLARFNLDRVIIAADGQRLADAISAQASKQLKADEMTRVELRAVQEFLPKGAE